MERGPLALFSAIVAVGLGPALWLGAQFGQARVIMVPPTISVVERNAETDPGGRGAADAEPDTALGDDTSKDRRQLANPRARTVRNQPRVESPTPEPPAVTDRPERGGLRPEASPEPSLVPTTTPPATSPAPDTSAAPAPSGEPSESAQSPAELSRTIVVVFGAGSAALPSR